MNKAEMMDNIQELIDALLTCGRKGKVCKKCKGEDKKNCLIFIRDTLAFVLQSMLASLLVDDIPAGIYS